MFGWGRQNKLMPDMDLNTNCYIDMP
jgi:hypothetical protein